MQNTALNNEMILFPIPLELFAETGLEPMDLLEMSAADGKIIIEKADISDFICGDDCDSCPINETDCEGECENCPCFGECDESEGY